MEEVWGQRDVYTCVHVCAHVLRRTGAHIVFFPSHPHLSCIPFSPSSLYGSWEDSGCWPAVHLYLWQGLSLRPELIPSSAMGPGVCSYAPTLMNCSGGLNSGPHQALDPWSHLSAKPSFLLFESTITTFLPSLSSSKPLNIPSPLCYFKFMASFFTFIYEGQRTHIKKFNISSYQGKESQTLVG